MTNVTNTEILRSLQVLRRRLWNVTHTEMGKISDGKFPEKTKEFPKYFILILEPL
jgi:hypothetical protein